MGPDSLRALVGEEFDSLTHRQHVLAHADAWEADRSLRRFAVAHRMAIGGRMDDYINAVYFLRYDPITEKAGLADLAWALCQGGNVSRGDWDGFARHWLAAALASKPIRSSWCDDDHDYTPTDEGDK